MTWQELNILQRYSFGSPNRTRFMNITLIQLTVTFEIVKTNMKPIFILSFQHLPILTWIFYFLTQGDKIFNKFNWERKPNKPRDNQTKQTMCRITSKFNEELLCCFNQTNDYLLMQILSCKVERKFKFLLYYRQVVTC